MKLRLRQLASGSAMGLVLGLSIAPAFAQNTTEDEVLGTIIISAEEQIKQALGVSNISAEDLEKAPVVNDVAEIIRKMPGVNLTGNSASGQFGNNRQIDIRGMGPENTLILIDGKPVLSRNSAKMGRAGERNTRGDSNWVPAELIDRIEVIRGPAAARYGSGSSGGVVNIITKRPDTFAGSVGLHFNEPESSKEGGNFRTNFMVAGPVSERLSFRLSGNYNRSKADSPEINDEAAGRVTAPAGREGVVNRDFGSLLAWKVADGHDLDFEFNFSKQANIYSGEGGTGSSGTTGSVSDNLAQAAANTSNVYRKTFAVTHRGTYDFGESMSYIQWENTRNSAVCVGTAGSGEGTPQYCVDTNGDGVNDAVAFRTVTLENITAKTEWILPTKFAGRESTTTFGAEIRHERIDDPTTPILGTTSASKTEQTNIGLYVESNIQWDHRLTLTPALRVDYADTYGVNISPSINATHQINDEWQLKIGLARAFKSPNLYQLNPDYRYTSNGNGCMRVDDGGTRPPYTTGDNTCYIFGNPDLKPETSVNAEIGISYANENGLAGSLTWFRNNYKDRITAGDVLIGYDPLDGRRMFVWDNTPRAVVEGLEGNFATPLGEKFALNVNATYMLQSKDKTTGQPLSLVPKHTINASVDWYARDNLTFTLSATNYGRIEPRTVNTSTGVAYLTTEARPSYTLVNLGAKWDINDSSRLSVGVTNLFDKKIMREGSATTTNSSANTFNEPGRALYLSLNKSF